MSNQVQIEGSEQQSEREKSANTFTKALDTQHNKNTVVAVTTTGAATLTIEFSTEETFGGEERAHTIFYDAAVTDQMEQFSVPYRYVRAKVDQNVTDVEVVNGGV